MGAEARKIKWPLTSFASGGTKQYVCTTHRHWGTHIPLTTLRRLTLLATLCLHRTNWDLRGITCDHYLQPQTPTFLYWSSRYVYNTRVVQGFLSLWFSSAHFAGAQLHFTAMAQVLLLQLCKGCARISLWFCAVAIVLRGTSAIHPSVTCLGAM